MANSDTTELVTERFVRGSCASERLMDVSFPPAVRGYDRRAVDQFLAELRTLVVELELSQTREGIVQRALDKLGEETAGILQRAHETADEITARSRAKADGRLQRAGREAEAVRREADEYAERVVVETRLLWQERQRLIEDIRQLADELQARADEAVRRAAIPEVVAIAEEEEEEKKAAAAPATSEDATPGPPTELADNPDQTVTLVPIPGGSDDPPAGQSEDQEDTQLEAEGDELETQDEADVETQTDDKGNKEDDTEHDGQANDGGERA